MNTGASGAQPRTRFRRWTESCQRKRAANQWPSVAASVPMSPPRRGAVQRVQARMCIVLWIRCYLIVQMKAFDPQEISNVRESFIAAFFGFTQDRTVRESVPRCSTMAPSAFRGSVLSVDIARSARLRIGGPTSAVNGARSARPPPRGQVSLWWPDQGNSVCSRRPPRQDGGTSGASRLHEDEFVYGGLPALTEASGSAAAAARYARIPGLAYPDASYLFSFRLLRGFARPPMYFPQVRTATMPGRGRLGSWFRRHVS